MVCLYMYMSSFRPMRKSPNRSQPPVLCRVAYRIFFLWGGGGGTVKTVWHGIKVFSGLAEFWGGGPSVPPSVCNSDVCVCYSLSQIQRLCLNIVEVLSKDPDHVPVMSHVNLLPALKNIREKYPDDTDVSSHTHTCSLLFHLHVHV